MANHMSTGISIVKLPSARYVVEGDRVIGRLVADFTVSDDAEKYAAEHPSQRRISLRERGFHSFYVPVAGEEAAAAQREYEAARAR